MGSLGRWGAGDGTGDVLFLDDEPAEENVDDHAAAAEDDVDGHGYVVCERGIVEDGEGKEECDLRKVWQEGYSTFSQPGKPRAGVGGELAWEGVEGDDEELEKGDEDA